MTGVQTCALPIYDDDDDDDKSKASFSYWGTGKITAQKSVTKQRSASVYSGESSTIAKFGHRLVSADSSPGPGGLGTRNGSFTVTRPAWDVPPRSVQSTKRSRNTATRTITTPPNKPPSEDSGVGLYRQMMANDLSLTDGSF